MDACVVAPLKKYSNEYMKSGCKNVPTSFISINATKINASSQNTHGGRGQHVIESSPNYVVGVVTQSMS
jgi:hypothetical protein